MNYSVLAEGTANTWWIPLHNDRKSWHRRIKKQRRYERLRSNTSQLCLWIMGGSDRAVRVGKRMHLTLTGWGCYSLDSMFENRMSHYILSFLVTWWHLLYIYIYNVNFFKRKKEKVFSSFIWKKTLNCFIFI